MCRNSDGFTLVEFLVSIVILMVGLLGLLQAVNFALQTNLATQLRNEAVVVADSQMSMELAKPFDLVSTTISTKPSVSRNIYNGSRTYSVIRSGQNLTDSKQVNIEVGWSYKGQSFTHTIFGVSSKTNK